MQPQGYRAFIPAPLPPDPPVEVSGSLQSLLSEADYALGRLDGAILTLPNPDLFVYMYVRKEAVLSSQIEGTQSSLQNLLAAEAQLLDPNACEQGEPNPCAVPLAKRGNASPASVPLAKRGEPKGGGQIMNSAHAVGIRACGYTHL
jgi:hypothetical protein